MSKPIDSDVVTVRVPVTFAQLKAINRRAGLSAWDGKARGEYIVGCVLSEPHDQLMGRVREIAETERKRLRAEIQAERAERAKRAKERPANGRRA